MLLSLIFCFLAIVLITIANYVNDEHECVKVLCWSFGIVFSTVFIAMIISTINLNYEFDYIKEEYGNLKQQVEYVRKDNVVTSENLRNQVLEMNNKISEHKIYSKNMFIGIYYSKDIGNLEKLVWADK